jgi:hypothetical protein
MLLNLEKFVRLKFGTVALGPKVAMFSCDKV